jgi:hypothetical protein
MSTGIPKEFTLIFWPRLKNTWVRFNFQAVDVLHLKQIECSHIFEGNAPEFHHESAVSYITAADKKRWRKDIEFFDLGLKPIDYPVRFYTTKTIERINPSRVLVAELYICPGTGAVWCPKQNTKFSDRLWKFRYFPGHQTAWSMGPTELRDLKKDSAFLSGHRLHRVGFRFGKYTDPRSFLYTSPKLERRTIVKSICRKLRGICKIRSLSSGESTFFKMMVGVSKMKQILCHN